MILPCLYTERLLLRPIRITDRNVLFALRSDPEQMRFIPRPVAQSIEDADDLLQNMLKGIEEDTSFNWSVTFKGDDTCIGVIGFYRMYPEHFRAEIGYMISSSHQGKGIAREAVGAMNAFGFSDLNLHTIEAVIDPENIASEKVLISLGFQKEAHFKQNIFFDGRFMDSVHYTLFR
jgi:ribosomal-protein-alanine N-acetyltransferase